MIINKSAKSVSTFRTFEPQLLGLACALKQSATACLADRMPRGIYRAAGKPRHDMTRQSTQQIFMHPSAGAAVS
jgi:hypothetical protein